MAVPKTKTNPFLRSLLEAPAGARAPEVLGAYPQVRLRRNRSDDWTRRLVAEARLSVDDLIWPLFVQEDQGASDVPSMPGVRRYGLDRLVDAVGRAAELGVPAVAVFPYLDEDLKTKDCAEAINPDNLVCRAVRRIKTELPEVGVICDVALDPYNALGHDGLVEDDVILNDETIEVLVRQAVAQAEAGCDVLAPSDMMDGRVGAVRSALDAAGFQDRKILAYAAKYASSFYGPFRDAVGSGGALVGDKKTYQMDPANSREALREVALDLAEGADMVMVKPGLPYLDIVGRVKEAFGVPTLAYQVSGEYAMIKAADANGWLDGEKAMMETLIAFSPSSQPLASAALIIAYSPLT